MPAMTVMAFYRRFVKDGRAVLAWMHNGEPRAWLTKPLNHKRTFCLCFNARDGIRFVDGHQPVPYISPIQRRGRRRKEQAA